MLRTASRPWILLSALLLAGCLGEDDRPLQVVAIGVPASPFVKGPSLPGPAQLLRAATFEGLVGFDAQGRVAPAIADRWIVTDDGQSFIFRLRDGKWGDGTPITADGARIALMQAIAAQRGTPLGQELAVIAEVKTMAGRVIELRLSRPQPDLLQLLAMPELGLVHGGRGSGPMKLRREKDSALLSLIQPEDRGLPPIENWEERARRLELSALPAKTAIERYRAGKADVVLGGTLADFPLLDTLGVPRRAVVADPVAGLFGLVAAHGDGFLAKAENREAISMAIDREALAASFSLAGWVVTTRIINTGLSEDNGTVGERWAGRSVEERRGLAAARVTQWVRAGRTPTLRIALPAGPGSDLIFARLSSDLKAIGLIARRVGANDDTDLRLIDDVAIYPGAAWFLTRLNCSNEPAACSPAADKFVEQALTEANPVRRAELFSEAEAQLTVGNGYIPLGLPVRWSLAGGSITGFAANRLAVHPLMSLAMLPK